MVFVVVDINIVDVFVKVVKNGVIGVELDIEFIFDGVFVLMYDNIVDRIIDGFGRLCDLIFE